MESKTVISSGDPTAPVRKHISIFSNVRWEHLAAGVTGGVISTVILHPLDLIKIRFQVNEGNIAGKVALAAERPQYRGIIDAVTSISRQSGLRGLYQGVTPNVWGAGASWGLYFLFYNSVKMWMQDRDGVTVLGPGKHMLAAGESGVLTLILTNPVWVAKTRICLQYDIKGASTAYSGMMDCLVKIYRTEGMRGLYKGFIPGVFGVSHGALQFMAYEELKKLYNGYRQVPPDTKFNSLEYLTFAAMSKMFAACTTYPYQVVRSRLQDQHRHYENIRDVLKQTWRYEGIRGFYKGMSPYLLHVTPNICIVFLIYEQVTNYVQRKDLAAAMANASLATTHMVITKATSTANTAVTMATGSATSHTNQMITEEQRSENIEPLPMLSTPGVLEPCVVPPMETEVDYDVSMEFDQIHNDRIHDENDKKYL